MLYILELLVFMSKLVVLATKASNLANTMTKELMLKNTALFLEHSLDRNH